MKAKFDQMLDWLNFAAFRWNKTDRRTEQIWSISQSLWGMREEENNLEIF